MLRQIRRGVGWQNIGVLGYSPSLRAKDHTISSVAIYDDSQHPYHVGISALAEDGKAVTLALPPNVCLEVLKGIISNLDPMHFAADDELLKMWAAAKAAVDRECDEVSTALKARSEAK